MPSLDDEEVIFNSALDRPAGDSRDAFLAEACADNTALRVRVEKLLSAYGEGECFQSPAAGLAATALLPPIGEKPGDAIGPYKLLEKIGEGGMGLVFMAEQSPPLRRRVALKIIKPGLDTHSVIARFEAERQALAMMDHANIAKVFDAGATDSGRPYFAMELVRGAPITDYCREQNLRLSDRLKLFIDVCQAVQHAHQKGVIHRDLKPTNILVSQCDTGPVPKVIDFGVAKATTQPLTERTLFTAFSQIVGTPLYMSPEQTDLGNQDVDTRSDVYSLGVVLYELLTGATPFDADRLRSVTPDELRRIIREEEPPKPSERATIAAALSTVAATPGAPRAVDVSVLHGDLDWIVMKALEKDRRRRYESPGAFAADISRYLQDEPVEAGPPTRRYRLTKFVRRRRVALLMTTVVAAALVFGSGAAIWQAIRATHAERAKGAALLQARRAVDEMYTKVAEKWLAYEGTLTDVQRELLESALVFYEEFSAEAATDPDAQYAALRALSRVGAIHDRLGNNPAAKTAFLKAIDRSLAAYQQNPERVEFRIESIWNRAALARLLRVHGQTDDTNAQLTRGFAETAEVPLDKVKEAAHRERLANGLAKLAGELTVAGRVKDAEKSVNQSLKAWQSLVTEFPENFDYRTGLATSYERLGLRQMWWGSTNGKAETTLRKADELFTALLTERPNDVECRRTLAVALSNLGVVLGWQEHPDDALKAHRRALELTRMLAQEFPDEAAIMKSYAISLGNLAASLERGGKGATAECNELLLTRQSVLEQLVDRHADRVEFAQSYLQSLTGNIGRLRAQGKRDDAERLLESVTERLARISDRLGADARVANHVALCLIMKAAQLIEKGNHRDASTHLNEIPPPVRRFRSDSYQVPDEAPEQYAGNQVDDYLQQSILLLTPAALLKDCVELARADATLAEGERATLADEYTVLGKQFRQEADLAIEAWITILDPQGKSGGFRTAFHGENLINDWIQNHHSNDGIHKHLREAYCLIDQLLLRRLVKTAAAQLSDEASQYWVSCMLSAAPADLRDAELALRMARRSLELAPDDGNARQSLGWALLRANQWEACLECLGPAETGKEDGPESIHIMALWQLGRRDEARALFKNAAQRLAGWEQKEQKKKAQGRILLPSTSMLKRLHEEAAAMLSPDAAAPPDDSPDAVD